MIEYLTRLSVANQRQRRDNLLEIVREIDAPFLHRREFVKDYRPENIIVSIGEGTCRYVFGAHYDSVPKSTGANDNAAGVCILLGLLKKCLQCPLPFAVDFAFFDLEEYSMIGSQAYINQIGKESIVGMVNFDVCGVGDTILVAQALQLLNESEKYSTYTFKTLPPSDDISFEAAGIPTLSTCVVPASDVPLFHNFSVAMHGMYAPSALPSVIQTIHNGSRDAIEFVDLNAMNMMLSWAVDLVSLLADRKGNLSA